MAGLSAILGESVSTARPRVEAMLHTLRWRGETQDIVCHPGTALGACRQTTPAASDAGVAFDETSGVGLAWTGTLRNGADLRAGLALHGTGDVSAEAALLLRLYLHMRAEWTSDSARRLLKRLRGDFAFVLHDPAAHRILAARDPAGRLPLYWRHDDDLSIASAPDALRTAGASAAVDPDGAWHYFHYGFVPAPLTVFEHVRKVPAGHYLLADDTDARLHRYRSLPATNDLSEAPVGQHLDEASNRLRSLVAERGTPGWCVWDGEPESAVLASTLETNGSLDGLLCLRDFDRATRFHDQPTATLPPWFAPHAFLDRLAQTGGEPLADPMLLVHLRPWQTETEMAIRWLGVGADEALGGRAPYRYFHHMRRYARLPRFLRDGITDRLLLRWAADPDRTGAWGLHRRIEGAHCLDSDSRAVPEALVPDAIWSTILQTPPPAGDRVRALAAQWVSAAAVTAWMRVDLETRLPESTVAMLDRVAAARNAPFAAPFLDPDWIDWTCRLPLSEKLGGGGRLLLRRLARVQGLPPGSAGNRERTIERFLAGWLRGPGRERAQALSLSVDPHRFRRDRIEALWQAHVERHRDHTRRLWPWVVWGAAMTTGDPH